MWEYHPTFRVKYFQYKIYLGNNLQYSLVLKCDTILKNRAPVSIFQTHSLWRHRIWIVELKCINAQIKALCHLKGIPLVPKLGKQKENCLLEMKIPNLPFITKIYYL